MLRAPACLCDFPHLRHLDLSSSEELTELPENLGRLPLVVLNLNLTNVRDLPVSLRETKTLRIIDLQLTWLSGPAQHLRPENVVLACGGFCTTISENDWTAFENELDRRDAILTPLSLAIPELRFAPRRSRDLVARAMRLALVRIVSLVSPTHHSTLDYVSRSNIVQRIN